MFCLFAGGAAATATATTDTDPSTTQDNEKTITPATSIKTEAPTAPAPTTNMNGTTNGGHDEANGYEDAEMPKPNVHEKPADGADDDDAATQSGASTPRSSASAGKARRVSVRAKKLSKEDIAMLSAGAAGPK